MTLCIFYRKYVLLAFGLTFATCLAISIYALVSDTDFTMFGGGLCIALIIVSLVSLLAFFLPREYGKPVEIAISGFVVFIMGLFIIYDL